MKKKPSKEDLKKMSHKEIEKAEEETGIDLDHDDEKGESKEHKEKIKKAKNFKEWYEERKKR